MTDNPNDQTNVTPRSRGAKTVEPPAPEPGPLGTPIRAPLVKPSDLKKKPRG